MGETFYKSLFFTQEPVLLGHTSRRAIKRTLECDDCYCGDLPASCFLQASKVNLLGTREFYANT